MEVLPITTLKHEGAECSFLGQINLNWAIYLFAFLTQVKIQQF